MANGPAAGQRIAAMAEEPRLISQRIMRQNANRDTKGRKPRGAIARQVKLPAPIALASCEKSRIGRITRQYCIAQISRHFIGSLMDTGANHSNDVAPRRTKPFHGEDGFFQHPKHRTTPAGMGTANHAGMAISEKHWCAIAGDDAKCNSRTPCHHAIRFGALIFRPGFCRHHHALAMHLRQSTKRVML
jgi:hypothetical protein